MTRTGGVAYLGSGEWEPREGATSLLGPLRLYIELKDAEGRARVLSSTAMTVTPVEEGCELRAPGWPGLVLRIVTAELGGGIVFLPELRNQGSEPVAIAAVYLRGRPPSESFAAGVGSEPGWRLYSAGYNSFSPAFARDSREVFAGPRLKTAGAFNQHAQSVYFDRPDCLSSPWLLALTREDAPARTLLCGFLSAETTLSEVALVRERPAYVEARWGLSQAYVRLTPGSSLALDPLWLVLGEGERLLSRWTAEVSLRMAARPVTHPQPVPGGWCSWYRYYRKVRPSHVIHNAVALRERGLPIRYVQLDDGYQARLGDWLSMSPAFEAGLAELVGEIRAAGFVPGLWLAPFLVQRGSEIEKHRRDWLLRDPDGQLRPLGYHPIWGLRDGFIYALDPSHPEVLDFLEGTFRALCGLGFDYFKIDFLSAGLREGRRFASEQTGVESYRAALSRIRAAIGERFLVGCGAPLLPSVGFCDALRISSDVKEDWRDPMLGLVAGECGHPAAELALQNCLTRAHLHGALFQNDPDCLLVRRSQSRLTDAEVETLAAVLSLTGGMILLGDDVGELDADRLQLAERALPPLGRAAQAQGLLTEAFPSRFVRRQDDEALAAVINWRDQTATPTVSAVELGLPAGPYHVYDCFRDRYHALAPDERLALSIAAHGTSLLLLRRRRDERPQVVSVTHHLGQTTALLKSESWDGERGLLSVELELPLPNRAPLRSGELLVFVPTRLRFLGAESASGPGRIELAGHQPRELHPTVLALTIALSGTGTLALRFAEAPRGADAA